ncbi:MULTISPECIES: PaaI family thioesterase [unclassified Janibacter]|uniref:PaaI family thioesterase n=1 Tax=unclassified Janibacter TaxID=2649294 RepID=UPI003D067E94
MTDGTFAAPEPPADPVALAEEERAYAALADAVRDLVDASVRTRATPEQVGEWTAQAQALADVLSASAQPGPLGLEVSSDGMLRDHGNPAVGARNPIAPPLHITKDPEGRAETTFTVGAAYEGPPGHLHGGMIALVLDQVLGTVPMVIGVPGLTANLSVTYRRPTPLGTLTCEAWVAERGDWKTSVEGVMRDPQGRVTAEAQAVFVLPRWARDRAGHPIGDAGEFPSLS